MILAAMIRGSYGRKFAFSTLLAIGALSIVFVSCGRGNKKSRPAVTQLSRIETVFQASAARHGIPVRMLTAVAYLESSMNPAASTAIYEGFEIGPAVGDSAFGIARRELGLAETSEADLATQIEAYASWLAARTSGVVATPRSLKEKANWLLQIGKAHRPDVANIQALFIREMITTLNSGFFWKDPIDGRLVEFKPEQPSIEIDELGNEGKMLELFTQRSSSAIADRFTNIRQADANGDIVRPIGIYVNHCPFSLSACLRIQASEADGRGAFMGNHFLIPADDSVHPQVIQVSLEDWPVPTLNRQGEMVMSDRVVVTLVGKSGTLERGIRKSAHPGWLTKHHLRFLGSLVEEICDHYSRPPNATMNKEGCKTIGEGLIFQSSSGQSQQQWGDIADFDRQIFASHIKNYKKRLGSVSFVEMDQTGGQTSPIKMTVEFQVDAKSIVLQELVRCENETIRWHSFLTRKVKDQTEFKYEQPVDDPGPNGNGEHFFRVKVFGSSQEADRLELMDWATTSIFLKGYDPEGLPYRQDVCDDLD